MANFGLDVQAYDKVELQGGFNDESVNCDYENGWECYSSSYPQRCWYTYICGNNNDQMWDRLDYIERYYNIDTRTDPYLVDTLNIEVYSMEDHDEVNQYLDRNCYSPGAVCGGGYDKVTKGGSQAGSLFVTQTDLLSLSRNCPSNRPCETSGGCKKMYKSCKSCKRLKCPRS